MLLKKLNDPVEILSGTRYFGGVCYFMTRPINKRFCKVCFGDLINDKLHSSLCSQKCIDEYTELMRLKKKKDAPLANCITCGTEFNKTYPKQVYCSTACRKETSRQNYLATVKSDFCIFERDGFKCIYCGKSSIEDGVKLNVEHIVPIKQGGKSEVSNLITSCKKCNAEKSIKIIDLTIIERIHKVINLRMSTLEQDKVELIDLEIAGLKSRRSI